MIFKIPTPNQHVTNIRRFLKLFSVKCVNSSAAKKRGPSQKDLNQVVFLFLAKTWASGGGTIENTKVEPSVSTLTNNSNFPASLKRINLQYENIYLY